MIRHEVEDERELAELGSGRSLFFSQLLVRYRSFNEIGRDGDIKCLW